MNNTTINTYIFTIFTSNVFIITTIPLYISVYKIYIMTDRYWRKIEDVENDIENAMQISSILLKLKGYDDDLSKIESNENNISSNSSQINTNTDNISTNLGKINVQNKYKY